MVRWDQLLFWSARVQEFNTENQDVDENVKGPPHVDRYDLVQHAYPGDGLDEGRAPRVQGPQLQETGSREDRGVRLANRVAP